MLHFNRFTSLIALCASILTISGFSDASDSPKLMVHYMPWYASKPVSGHWGWHWTMNRFDPEKTDEIGKREIASHYYPLIGPYDSSDPVVLEYHILLMKLAGIHGIIIDWYGIEDFYDYATLNRNTSHIIDFARKAGLEFAICYEDQTVKHMVNRNHIGEDDSIKHARKDMKYLQGEWFHDRLYLKLGDRPVLLVFGPQYFMKSSQWDSLFSVLDIRPQFFTQDHRLSPSGTGAFSWPPMWKSQDGVLSWESCNDYLDQFYEKAASWPSAIGTAFPGFHDVYEEAGGRNSYGYLDAQEGKIFDYTLHKAIINHTDIIQIVTWNDFGEGTNIEPTEEYGYRYLETIQELRRKHTDPRFPYVSEDLTLCKQLYDLRRKYGDNQDIMLKLDEVFDLLLTGKLADAKKIMTGDGL